MCHRGTIHSFLLRQHNTVNTLGSLHDSHGIVHATDASDFIVFQEEGELLLLDACLYSSQAIREQLRDLGLQNSGMCVNMRLVNVPFDIMLSLPYKHETVKCLIVQW